MLTQGMSQSLSIVGAGRVGRALGRKLHDLGWRIVSVTDHTLTTARAAVREIGAGHPSGLPTRQILESELVLITTPDEVIESVAENLAKIGGQEWRGKVVLHTSGAIDSSALKPLADLGAAVASMHPMQTFGEQSAPELAGRFFGIEGCPTALKTARKMIRQMGGVAVRLSGSNKAAYHAAGLFACAHVLALMETSTRLLMTQGFTRRRALRALLPLTRQMLDNFESLGPHAAWTGPMKRGDFSTVKRHVRTLSEFPHEYLEAYEALSRLTGMLLSGDPGAMLRQLDREFGPGPKRKKN
jgi:predicted short-subunit dehydrogenase-like oxidoreductase (DUF2520 family)